MKIICLGNNTEESDILSRQLAESRQLDYRGLISDIDEQFDLETISQDSVYHSTVFDCAFGRLLKICNQFDEVVMLDQTKNSYGHPDTWLKTIKIIQEAIAPVKV